MFFSSPLNSGIALMGFFPECSFRPFVLLEVRVQKLIDKNHRPDGFPVFEETLCLME
jgi:hypothetical protein